MKQLLYSISFGLIFVGSMSAQFNCLSDEVFRELMRNDSVFRKNQETLELETQQHLQNKSQSAAATYVIPVVFHVIYTTPAGNISDAQILDQMDILNKEFRRQQADTILTPAAFLPFAAPLDIEFRLATKDPSGNCSNGINRIYNNLSNCSAYNDEVKSLSYWPSNNYLNVWVVQTMHYDASTNCGGGGYARFPGGSPAVDGVNIRGDLIGSIGTAATNANWGNFLGRYLIHELGHWFNLRHIWGDATCGNDFVADTPPHVFSNSGCPNFPRNPNSNCSGSNANGEMFTNYMDYTDGPCLNMFSAGQVARMTAALNSSISGRNNLWTLQNLLSTGTADPYTYPAPCVAVPDILPYDLITACVGDSVKLTDKSYGGLLSSRTWSVPGGTANSLSDSIIKVKYNSPGLYDVSLTNTYLSNTKTSVFANKVLVLNNTPNPNYVYPFTEDLEDSFMFSNNWTIRNHNAGSSTWELNNSTSFSGNNCVAIHNFNKSAPLIDELISPEYDLSAVFNPTLSFQLHFASRAASDNDKLQVFISNNCGKTWNSIYQKTSNGGLKTTTVTIASSYTPAPASPEWRLEKANILNVWAGGKVNLKFVFTSGSGNNIFIDDINIDGINTTGINESKPGGKLLVFPNPTNNRLNLSYELNAEGEVQIEVSDLLGKSLIQEYATGHALMKTNRELNIEDLAPGTYLLTIKQRGAIILSTKVIRNTH